MIWWLLTGVLVGAALTAGAGLLWVRRLLAARQRSHQQALRSQTRARNAERLAEIGTLTGGLAHEIKNPLSIMRINLQLLTEDMAEPASDRERRNARKVRTLTEQVDRLKEILDDFLQYAGRHELHAEPHDLNRVVEGLVDFFQPQAAQSKVRILASYAPAPLICRIDVELLKQALLNLFLNAQQAMADGGELIIRLRRAGASAQLDVIDTGIGIPADKRDHIFHAYWTNKPGGSGLGLPLVRRIVSEHDGTISFTSEVGKGTQFTIDLPLVEPPPDAAPASQPPEPAGPAPQSAG